MNNIPEHILQQVADAPFLAGGIGEYTDEELRSAWSAAEETNTLGIRWLRAFLAALPRRESPALAQAIARAEKAEAGLTSLKEERDELDKDLLALLRVLNSYDTTDGVETARYWKNTFEKLIDERNNAQAELAALKSSPLGILRPIAEMPETVPEGCMAVFRWRDDFGSWVTGINKPTNGFFAILRLPDAEFTPPAEFAAQVPLGPEDCPPGSVFTFGAAAVWVTPLCVSSDGVGFPDTEPNKPLIQKFSFELLQEVAKINTSLPDTGRWDANAWRDCSKPAGKEVAK